MWTKEWKMITGLAGGVAAILGAVQLFPVAEQYVPVTHSYLRSYVPMEGEGIAKLIASTAAQVDKADEARVEAARKERLAQFDAVNQQLLETQVTIVEGQLRAARAEFTDLELKEATNVGGNRTLAAMILERKNEVAASISSLERQSAALRCTLNKARGFVSGC